MGCLPGLLRRPEDPDHARPRRCSRRPSRRSSQILPVRLRTAVGVAGGDRQQDRRGPGDGRRPDRQRAGGLRALPVQPRHRRDTASRAPRSSRSRSPRRCMQGISPGLGLDVRARRTSSSPTAAARSTSSSTTSATRTRARSRSPDATTISDNSVYSQVGIKVGTANDRAARRAGWGSARRSPTTTR